MGQLWSNQNAIVRLLALSSFALAIILNFGCTKSGKDVVETESVVEAPAAEEEDEVFAVVEEMPTLLGGVESLHERIVYPDSARRAGVEGRVLIEFVVDKEGNVKDAIVLEGVGAGCNEAALEAVRESKFTVGKQRDQPVAVKMTLPVVFRLN